MTAKKVLLVEDEEDVLQSLKIGLERQGYDVSIAKNGAEALKSRLWEVVDIIVSDVRMPEMDGIEMFKRITEQGYKKPFVFISGHLLEMGAEDQTLAGLPFLAKPFSSTELAKTIAKTLEGFAKAR